MGQMLEFSGPTDKPLEDEHELYPSDADVKRALSEERARSQAILDEAAARRKKALPRTGLVNRMLEDLD